MLKFSVLEYRGFPRAQFNSNFSTQTTPAPNASAGSWQTRQQIAYLQINFFDLPCVLVLLSWAHWWLQALLSISNHQGFHSPILLENCCCSLRQPHIAHTCNSLDWIQESRFCCLHWINSGVVQPTQNQLNAAFTPISILLVSLQAPKQGQVRHLIFHNMINCLWILHENHREIYQVLKFAEANKALDDLLSWPPTFR